ncbi:MAG TPA: T9SS type A sorting domain-containing protein [Candidatus Eisenbacteria bacterium]|nr:T9SS type A sorting domain-containing protein [Candidatus Eisenbacteria bacterium]
MRCLAWLLTLSLLVLGLGSLPGLLISRTSDTHDFVHFESSHVHPLALTPNGNRLLAVNTADNRLTVFDLAGASPVRLAEIPVGLEPVSVVARSDVEAWVVNHLSDDISIVDLSTLHVKATLQVGDEPSDVVFAAGKAYVSVSQEDAVKVYDASTRQFLQSIPIAGRMPRALATNAAGTRVYVAVFHAGNRTSVLSEQEVTFGSPPRSAAPPPNPPLRPGLPPPPITGLIVQQQAGQWRDEAGQVWSSTANPTGQRKIFYDLFDTDVAEIATATNTVVNTFSDIGAVNFGLAVSATDGRVAVTATEPRNLTRFEPNLRGHMVDTRAGLITAGGAVSTFDLNPTINYATTPGPPSDLAVAIGLPTGVAWGSTGQRLYVTALANDRIAEIDVSGVPVITRRMPTIAGPTGIAVDAARNRVYVLGRFRNQLQTLSAVDLSVVATNVIGFDPTPDAIVNGRKFFYGGFTSGHGDQACASCHVFGDFDNLAWDLGNPQGNMEPVDLTGQALAPLLQPQVHPMKGPMTTQSLRGLSAPTYGDFHWRADRASLDAFNPAFVNLMGRATALPDTEIAAFNAFVAPLAYPPNPNQTLNRDFSDAPLHSPSAKRGQTFFFNQPVDGGQTCNFCHAASSFGPGTGGQITPAAALQESQDMKVPQLRNMYKKTGFTDGPVTSKRGFGFIHDGSTDNLFNFLRFSGFNFSQPSNQTPDENRRDVEAFLLAFDTGLAPSVGAQVTLPGGSTTRFDTLAGEAQLGHCALIAKGRVGGQPRGWWYQGAGTWMSDKAGESISTTSLMALAGPGSEVTVTGVAPGLGRRMGIDRDRDTFLDFDEVLAGSNPGDPGSTPNNVGVGDVLKVAGIRGLKPNPFGVSTELTFGLSRTGRVDCVVHDLLGRHVRSIARGEWREAGLQSLRWDGQRDDGRSASPGVYFIRLTTGEGSWSRNVVKLR